jgi:hypothetical protein
MNLLILSTSPSQTHHRSLFWFVTLLNLAISVVSFFLLVLFIWRKTAASTRRFRILRAFSELVAAEGIAGENAVLR